MADLAKMSKTQLETYARKVFDVELDRRHTKKQLLAEVQELVEKEVEVLTPPATKPKASPSSINVKDYIEKHSGEQRDCATIWRVINNNPKYTTDKEILDLIKLKEYITLLGEVS